MLTVCGMRQRSPEAKDAKCLSIFSETLMFQASMMTNHRFHHLI